MLGLCCWQSFVRLWQVFRCAACVFRQPLFSAFVPVQSLFGGTRARQLLMSCLQSLRQWLAFAAAPPARIRTAPTIAAASPRARFLCTSRALLPRARLRRSRAPADFARRDPQAPPRPCGSHLSTSRLALWLTPNSPLLRAPHASAADSHPAEPYDPLHAPRPDERQSGSDAWPKPRALIRPTG